MRNVIVSLAVLAVIPVASAAAAEMPLKAPPVPYTGYNWTGFYAGAEFGGGWASQTATILTQTGTFGNTAFPPGTVTAPTNPSGVLGGFYGGGNYQINQFVLGIDGDYNWADLTGSSTDVSPFNGAVAGHNIRMNWLATVTGRVGYVVNNNWLLFAKGGAAWAGWSSSSSTTNAAGALVSTSTGSSTRDGWTVGGGVEWAFNAHWSAKLEYDYVQFARLTTTETDINAATGAIGFPTRSVISDVNVVKAGIAYHF
jgi:outer membrane immunogenic protein